MANARLARFITEVAPPQFISVMRHRTSKMLDTIHEDEKEAGTSTMLPSSPTSRIVTTTAATATTGVAASLSKKKQQLLMEVQRSYLTVFNEQN